MVLSTIWSFFILIGELFLAGTLITSFLGGYLYVYVLILVYNLNKRIFFPKENNKDLRKYIVGVLLILLVNYFFWVIVGYFNPNFFGPIQIGNTLYLISPNYTRVNSLLTAIILFFIGLMVHKEAESFGRVINEV